MSNHQHILDIQAELPAADRLAGSGQLRSGAALLRAGFRRNKYLGAVGGEHRWQLSDGRQVSVDMVILRVSAVVGGAFF